MGRLGRALNMKKKLARPQLPARDSKNKSVIVKSYAQRQETQRKLQQTKELEQSLVEAGKQKRIVKAKKRDEKKKRKIENEIKSGQYQVIKNTQKIKNWNKQAKKTLMKVSPEMLAQIKGHY